MESQSITFFFIVLLLLSCGELYVSLWNALFGKREMQEFFRIKRDQKRRCGIYFTVIRLCGLLVPIFFRGVPLSVSQLNWLAVCDFPHYFKHML